MVRNMREIGKMIFKMDMGNNAGKTDQNMKDTINKVKSMEKVIILGPMDLLMMVIGKTTR